MDVLISNILSDFPYKILNVVIKYAWQQYEMETYFIPNVSALNS